MQTEKLKNLVLDALEDLKARDVCVLDVRSLTTITEWMIVASGTSDRHVRALAGNVIDQLAEQGVRPLGVEGERQRQWVLVDFDDVIVHVMLPQIRDFYQLEKLWRVEPFRRTATIDT